MSDFDVFGVGNALVDIQAQVTPEFLLEHGIDKGVMTLVSAAEQKTLLAALDETKLKIAPGGSACNTVVGVAGMGGSAYYAGKVGKDRYGEFFQRELDALGVRSDLPPVGEPTGTCLVLNTPDADRTMLTCLSASVQLNQHDIQPAVIAASGVVYVEGYLWDAEGPRAACQAAMVAAADAGIPVAFSYSDPYCVGRSKDDFIALTRKQVQMVFCNEEEARMITGVDNGPDACRMIASWGPQVFMTSGAEGAHYAAGDVYAQIPAFKVDAVDTNGAGDLFAAGALFGLSRGSAPEAAGLLGSFAASRVVQQIGARLSGSVKDDALALLSGS